jgi:hypothetical protein
MLSNEKHRRGAGWVSEAEGLDDMVRGVRPQVCFFGHHHTRLDATIDGVRCIGLNKVRCQATWLSSTSVQGKKALQS